MVATDGKTESPSPIKRKTKKISDENEDPSSQAYSSNNYLTLTTFKEESPKKFEEESL